MKLCTAGYREGEAGKDIKSGSEGTASWEDHSSSGVGDALGWQRVQGVEGTGGRPRRNCARAETGWCLVVGEKGPEKDAQAKPLERRKGSFTSSEGQQQFLELPLENGLCPRKAPPSPSGSLSPPQSSPAMLPGTWSCRMAPPSSPTC